MAVKTTKLGSGYGSTQADTKLAVGQLVASAQNLYDNSERIARDSRTQAGLYPGDASYSALGGMRFVWSIETPSQIVYVRAEFTTTGCYRLVSMELITNPTPEIPTDLEDIAICDINLDGIEIFDLYLDWHN